jgi:hypothetical protein
MKLKTITKKKVIEQGHTDDLIKSTPTSRIWISRLTIADGMPYDNQVTEEKYNTHKGKWETVKVYEAV